MMKERGILFSAPMVRALLDGRKTMTRRIVKDPEQFEIDDEGKFCFSHSPTCGGYCDYACAASGEVLDGHIGWTPWGSNLSDRNRLVPLTTWAAPEKFDNVKPKELPPDVEVWSHWSTLIKSSRYGKLRPGRFMPLNLRHHLPRLEITGVKVERVQDISQADVIEEGVEIPVTKSDKPGMVKPLVRITGKCDPPYGWPEKPVESDYYRHEYAFLWDEINGAGSWAANPWCWVIGFKRLALKEAA